MSDTIVAALISASASVLAAILAIVQRQLAGPVVRTRAAPSAGRRVAWAIVVFLLLIWLALSPALIHHDLAGENFLLIPIVTILLALVAPINPLAAASIILALHAGNAVIGPESNRLAGSPFDTDFGEYKLGLILGIAFGNAFLVLVICFLRRRFGGVKMLPVDDAGNDRTPQNYNESIAVQLGRLAGLHEAGKLSDDEFRRAKEKLLGP